ncbi:MAG: sigma-70 family RNA polymerase sigma factor, partial [Gammaproteobacteria bacterium]|nr:sigma-70 family RNA polymerase sigma factor [Gammaproteobacteria bacterium]
MRTPKRKTGSAAEPADERRERELLRGMLAGDDDSFETVMVLHGAQVTRLARRYLCNEADAAECVQDTFLKVFQNIASFERRSSLWTWIRRIAINECLMRLRQIKRRAEEDIEELLPVFDESGSRVDPS